MRYKHCRHHIQNRSYRRRLIDRYLARRRRHFDNYVIFGYSNQQLKQDRRSAINGRYYS